MNHGSLFAALLLFVVSFGGPVAAEEVLDQDPYASRKVFYEDYWQKKIERVLTYVPGIVVCVEVELTPEIETTVKREEFVGAPVTETESEVSKTRIESAQHESGSSVSQAPSRDADGVLVCKESNAEVHNTVIVPRKETMTTHAGLTPRTVAASIVVPRSYARSLLSTRPRDESDESGGERAIGQIEKEIVNRIELIVEPLLPDRVDGGDDYSQVTVLVLDDLRTPMPEAAKETIRVKLGDLITVAFSDPDNPTTAGGESGDVEMALTRGIAARVVGVRPDGRLIVEAHRTIKVDDSIRQVSLTGEVDPGMITADRLVLPEQVTNLRLEVEHNE